MLFAERSSVWVKLSAVMVYAFVFCFCLFFFSHLCSKKDTTQGILCYEDIQGPALLLNTDWPGSSLLHVVAIYIQAMVVCPRVATNKYIKKYKYEQR